MTLETQFDLEDLGARIHAALSASVRGKPPAWVGEFHDVQGNLRPVEQIVKRLEKKSDEDLHDLEANVSKREKMTTAGRMVVVAQRVPKVAAQAEEGSEAEEDGEEGDDEPPAQQQQKPAPKRPAAAAKTGAGQPQQHKKMVEVSEVSSAAFGELKEHVESLERRVSMMVEEQKLSTELKFLEKQVAEERRTLLTLRHQVSEGKKRLAEEGGGAATGSVLKKGRAAAAAAAAEQEESEQL